MASRILDAVTYPDLQPASTLWALYDPDHAPLRFQATTPAAAAEWRDRVRAELRTVVGFQDLPAVAAEPILIETVDRGDHVREKVLIRTSAHSQMPVYLLRPKGATGPLPVVIAFHGHGYGAKDIVGLWEDGEERFTADGYHKDFGVALCRRGFAVAVPEISCFGERQTRYDSLTIGQSAPNTCHHTAALASHLGGSAAGMRVLDSTRLIDYLATRPGEFDVDRVGAMGISGGGLHVLFSAALDLRIKASVISGYYCTFRDSIFAMAHCPCNFVPGLSRFGEMYDMIGLVAPRPFLAECGTRDPIFPIGAVRRSLERARQVYTASGAAVDAVQVDEFEGRHQISGRLAYDFLADQLGLA